MSGMKAFAFPLLAVIIFLASVPVLSAHALTFELDKNDSNGVCENEVGGTWDGNTATCTAISNTLNFITLQVDSGVTLVYNGASMINQGSGIVDNLGTIDINSGGGFSIIGPVASLANSGTINVNSGNLGGGGPISNSGTININSGGHLGADGTVNNTGTISVSPGGSISNDGTINNGGTLGNAGTADNYGTITSSGTVHNTGAITNHAGATFLNNPSGDISNPGTITNECGAVFTNDGTLTGNPVIMCATTITISSSQNPSAPGQQVTFTADITPSGATGTVTFNDSSTVLGTAAVSGGTASFTTSSLAVGTHHITARYSGSADYQPSTSQVLGQAVSKAPTTITLQSSQNPSPAGQQVTFTAGITPATAGGTVTFSVDGTAGSPVPVSGGQAAITVPTLAAGMHNVTAAYSGDAADSASTSAVLRQNVTRTVTTVVVQSSQNPSSAGQPVTFNATVSPGTATGTVTFVIDGTSGFPVPLLSGRAAFTTSTLAVGSHNVTALYSGDGSNEPGTAQLSQEVNAVPTSTALQSSQNPSAAGQQVTFTATISPGTATGTVTFSDNGTALGSAAVSSGVAALSAPLSAGVHNITASYSGPGFGPSSASLVQTVLGSTAGKVTGGGHIGRDRNFGFEVSSDDGKTFRGHLEYNDRAARMDLDSSHITRLYVNDSMTGAVFAGNATSEGHDGKRGAAFTFLVSVTDPDKTGEHDTFSIIVTNSTGGTYQGSGTVQGHIEIHKAENDRDHHGNEGQHHDAG